MKNSKSIRKGGSILAAALLLTLAACGSKDNGNPAPVPPGPIVPGGCPPTGCVSGTMPLGMAAGGTGYKTMVLGLQFLAQSGTSVQMGSYAGPFVAQGEFFVNQATACISATGAIGQIPAGRYIVQVTTPGNWMNGPVSTFQMQANGPVPLTLSFAPNSGAGSIIPTTSAYTSPSGAVYNYYLAGWINIDALSGTPCSTGGALLIGP